MDYLNLFGKHFQILNFFALYLPLVSKRMEHINYYQLFQDIQQLMKRMFFLLWTKYHLVLSVPFLLLITKGQIVASVKYYFQKSLSIIS